MISLEAASFIEKHKGKLLTLVLAVTLYYAVARISESQKIGSYKPKVLSDAYTSYVAYNKGDSTILYPPVLKWFVHGGIGDCRSDGIVDEVGTIRYPKLAPLTFSVDKLSKERRGQVQNE